MKDDSRVNTPVRHCVYDSLHLFSLPLSLSPPILSLSFNVFHRERERESFFQLCWRVCYDNAFVALRAVLLDATKVEGNPWKRRRR